MVVSFHPAWAHADSRDLPGILVWRLSHGEVPILGTFVSITALSGKHVSPKECLRGCVLR